MGGRFKYNDEEKKFVLSQEKNIKSGDWQQFVYDLLSQYLGNHLPFRSWVKIVNRFIELDIDFYSGLYDIPQYLFCRCDIPSKMRLSADKIGDYAFAYSNGLKKLYATECQTVGKNAFSSTSLERVYLDSCMTIESYAFSECEKLTDVYLPKLKYANINAFGRWANKPFHKKLTIPEDIILVSSFNPDGIKAHRVFSTEYVEDSSGKYVMPFDNIDVNYV